MGPITLLSKKTRSIKLDPQVCLLGRHFMRIESCFLLIQQLYNASAASDRYPSRAWQPDNGSL